MSYPAYFHPCYILCLNYIYLPIHPLHSSTPQYTRANITFNILNPEPVPRPGYNDFYHTEELFDFVMARKVRVKMKDHYFVKNERHRYYALHEFSVAAK